MLNRGLRHVEDTKRYSDDNKKAGAVPCGIGELHLLNIDFCLFCGDVMLFD